MDLIFSCPFCNQEISVDDSYAGTEISCPSCNEALIIPSADYASRSSAQARETRSLTVPASGSAAKAEIHKPNTPLEVAAKGNRKIRIKTFRHAESVKDGKDRFDEVVSEFLQHHGEGEVVGVHTIHYDYFSKEANQKMTDYGVVVIYRG